MIFVALNSFFWNRCHIEGPGHKPKQTNIIKVLASTTMLSAYNFTQYNTQLGSQPNSDGTQLMFLIRVVERTGILGQGEIPEAKRRM